MNRLLSENDLAELLKQLFPHQKLQVKPLVKGLLNQNNLVTTANGSFVLKVYRPEVSGEELDAMHAMMAFLRTRGIPVAALIDQVQFELHHVALYTFLPGTNPGLYSRSLTRIAAMGDLLGRIHVALDLYAKEYQIKLPATDLILPSAEEKIKKIEQLCEQTRSERPPHTPEFLLILRRCKERLESQSWDLQVFDKLPRHLCHGDFHTKNLLFHGDQLTGVLDWEKQGWGGHAFEVMRTIIYNCRRTQKSLNWQSVRVYAQSYLRRQALTPLECQLAFSFAFQKMMFGTWMEEGYLKGRHELWSNVQRRHDINEYLFKHKNIFNERMTQIFTG